MKKTLVSFVMMMMVVMVNAQGSYDFMFNNVATTKTNVKPITSTRSLTVDQLAQASARRSGNTATRRNTTTPAQQTYTNDTQDQLIAQASANQMQQRVVFGKVENVYIMGGDLIKITVSPARGSFGRKNQEFVLVGYASSIDIVTGDFVTFVATYDMAYDCPAIYNNQIIDPAGMQRVYNDRLDYYGDVTAMYGAYPCMTKWGRIMNNVMAGAMTVASIVSLVKAIF